MASRKYIFIGLIFLVAVGAVFLSFTTAHAPGTPDISVPTREELSDSTVRLISEETIAREISNTPSPKTMEERLLHTIPVTEPGVALDAMRRYADSTSDFSFTTRTFPGLGEFVESIGGMQNRNGFYWTLFINGALSEYGVSSLSVMPGDVLEWRYQKGI